MSGRFARFFRLTMVAVPLLLTASLDCVEGEELKPPERAAKGFALLEEKKLSLIAIQTEEGGASKREPMASYVDLVLVVNQRRAVSFHLLGPKDEDREVCSLKPAELAGKVLGPWLWYKVCATAEIVEDCQKAGVIS